MTKNVSKFQVATRVTAGVCLAAAAQLFGAAVARGTMARTGTTVGVELPEAWESAVTLAESSATLAKCGAAAAIAAAMGTLIGV